MATGTGPIEVIDTATGTRLTPINFGGSNKLATSPDGKYLYASQGNTIAKFDVSTDANTLITQPTIGTPNTHTMTLSDDGSRLYLADYTNGKVTTVNTATMTVVGVTFMDRHPWGVAVTPDGSRVLTANVENDTVSVIDPATNTVADIVNVGRNNYDVAVAPNGLYAYVTNAIDNTITVLQLTPSPL